MKSLDELLNLLSFDVAKGGIDANSPGEMVRSQLAGQMPGMAPRPPMSLSGRASVGAPVAPVQRSSMPPVTASAPPMASMNVGAAPTAPMPAPVAQPSGFEDFLSGAAANNGDWISGFVNASAAPRQRAEKARAEQQALAQQNQTVQFLVSNKGLDPTQAALVARNPDLLQSYLKPQDPNADLSRRKTEAEIAKLEREAAGGFDREALTRGAGPGKMWIDPNDPTKGVRDIPGAEKPVKPPTAIQTEAGKAEMAYNSLIPAIDNYVNTVRKYGAEAMPGPGKDLMGQQLRDIQLQLKELYNLGVLNGPDLALMEQMLFDPRIGFNPLDLANTINPVSRTEQSADELKRILTRIRDTKVQQARGEAPQPQAAAPAANAPPVRISTDEHWQQLPPGTKYIDPDGNERVKQ